MDDELESMLDEKTEDCEECAVTGSKLMGTFGIILGLVILYVGIDVFTGSKLTSALVRKGK